MRQIFAILWKDLLVEFKSKESLLSMFIFGLLILVIFNFALEPTPAMKQLLTPGLLWVTFLFTGVLGLNRSFALEKENMAIQGMLLAPVDRGLVYFGKFGANLIVLLLAEVMTLPFFMLFLNMPLLQHFWLIMAIIFLGTFGFVAVGTLFSAMATNVKMSEVMLPLLLFPVATPILLASVASIREILAGEPFATYQNWFMLLVGFDLIFIVVPSLIFEYVVEE
ncbi:MAG: heme exporter protein CcmB [Candidatus Marinimicrobia bacterium]|nr:heme exporter protein CcmB [Candidatus Neomarinimicrobiota bacterium]MCF7828988.1 heme exporter protein CcmB [Candidatus Neomarinimicrobiota bacterium]MCF7879948.1 heme exporter protein CcmB [Candidatus Neomarinimicrobiota bacterium]